MTSIRFGLWGLLLAFATAVHAAELMTTSEAAGMLHRMAFSARILSYQGTYLYQHGDVLETFRLAHVFDGNGETERRESLDGVPREFIRNNDQIVCYMRDAKPFSLDRRTANKFFPGVLLDQAADIVANYSFRRSGSERVAGQECQTVLLEPNDRLRHPHKLCVDAKSGLMLKSVMYNPVDRSVVEQFTFTQLEIGGAIDRRLLKSQYAGAFGTPPAPAASTAPSTAGPTAARFDIGGMPSGFRLVTEMQNQLPGKPRPVQHLLFSDGLVTVSVFIEPVGNGPVSLPLQRGGLNFFSRQADGWRITALGEVPLRTVQMFTMAFSPR